MAQSKLHARSRTNPPIGAIRSRKLVTAIEPIAHDTKRSPARIVVRSCAAKYQHGDRAPRLHHSTRVLFCPQCHHRVDASGATSWQKTGEKRSGRQQDTRKDKCEGIGWAYLIKNL